MSAAPAFSLNSGDILRGFVAGDFEEELAGERISVGVKTGRGESDEDVAGPGLLARDEFVAIDGADEKASETVLAFGVKAGHLGSFAADEGAAVGAAGVSEALRRRSP